MDYEIFEFKYKDKQSKEIKTILAREVELADYIIGLYNEFSTYCYQKVRFGFKRKVYISCPPDIIENQEIDTAQQLYISRAEQNGKGLL